MIARQWKGRTRPERAAEYLEYLQETGVAECRKTPGNLGVRILTRTEGGAAEFLFVSLWESWDAIRRFAGDTPETAVYYPKDREFLLELEPRVEHFEVAVDIHAQR